MIFAIFFVFFLSNSIFSKYEPIPIDDSEIELLKLDIEEIRPYIDTLKAKNPVLTLNENFTRVSNILELYDIGFIMAEPNLERERYSGDLKNIDGNIQGERFKVLAALNTFRKYEIPVYLYSFELKDTDKLHIDISILGVQ
jgi:hypothetical protein